MEMDQGLGEHMDRQTCYAWGNLFASPWERLVEGMRSRAAQAGFVQEDGDGCLTWKIGEEVRARFLFVDDPSDIESIRRIYNDEANVRSPVCFIVVRQPDPTDNRGDIIFDIFRLSPQSYLWHFYRVFTPPKGSRQ
jgi:hypothetical protein